VRLAGKSAIVTGGNSGIGAAIAKRFADEGARVLIACRNTASGGEVADAIRAAGGVADVVRCDVTSDADVGACVQRAGVVDVLVNCAGEIRQAEAVTEVSEARWQQTLDVNLSGTFRVSRAVIPLMAKKGGGSIVNVASVGGLCALPRAAPYVVSKHGVVALTESMALDYASFSVRVNCVCPGFVDTPLLRQTIDAQPEPHRARLYWTSLHPLGRLGQPDDVAGAVLFLASDDARWITGATLPVDGGFLLRRVAAAPPEL
jgi:NAD(P)-dependent dehydrogenase (short-subunit alcohol dehydrogenase family)